MVTHVFPDLDSFTKLAGIHASARDFYKEAAQLFTLATVNEVFESCQLMHKETTEKLTYIVRVTGDHRDANKKLPEYRCREIDNTRLALLRSFNDEKNIEAAYIKQLVQVERRIIERISKLFNKPFPLFVTDTLTRAKLGCGANITRLLKLDRELVKMDMPMEQALESMLPMILKRSARQKVIAPVKFSRK